MTETRSVNLNLACSRSEAMVGMLVAWARRRGSRYAPGRRALRRGCTRRRYTQDQQIHVAGRCGRGSVLRADRRGVRAPRRHEPVEHGQQRRVFAVSAADGRQQWRRLQSGQLQPGRLLSGQLQSGQWRNRGPIAASGSRTGRRPGHVRSIVTTLSIGTDTFSVFGTTATLLVSDPGLLDHARAIADAELAAVDMACSRFRPDSELSRLNGSGGAVVPVSRLFAELVDAALRAARLTDGDVDPTCGQALEEIGYDRDFAVLQAAGVRSPGSGQLALGVPGWRCVRLDRKRGLAQLTDGAQLDLGATAKAWAADRCASLIAAATESGVLVSLGGDIAVAGPPPADRGEGRGGGWGVRVTDDHAAGPEAPGQTVTIRSGGLATSSTTVRTWALGGRRVHHIIDPATGEPARSVRTDRRRPRRAGRVTQGRPREHDRAGGPRAGPPNAGRRGVGRPGIGHHAAAWH